MPSSRSLLDRFLKANMVQMLILHRLKDLPTRNFSERLQEVLCILLEYFQGFVIFNGNASKLRDQMHNQVLQFSKGVPKILCSRS